MSRRRSRTRRSLCFLDQTFSTHLLPHQGCPTSSNSRPPFTSTSAIPFVSPPRFELSPAPPPRRTMAFRARKAGAGVRVVVALRFGATRAPSPPPITVPTSVGAPDAVNFFPRHPPSTVIEKGCRRLSPPAASFSVDVSTLSSLPTSPSHPRKEWQVIRGLLRMFWCCNLGLLLNNYLDFEGHEWFPQTGFVPLLSGMVVSLGNCFRFYLKEWKGYDGSRVGGLVVFGWP
ncbi:hypothetical protein ACSQ67_004216 [Phaseolus vulgaris]